MRAGRSSLRAPLAALLVFLGCFMGALVFARFNFPGIRGATLFPPYAVLTSALLVTPRRHWWAMLLASALGNFAPHLLTGPPAFALLTELANFSRALVVALLIQRFDRGGAPFASFRGAAIFVVAAMLVGPAVGAFIGAGVVAVLRGGDYWLTWQGWFLSNALTALTLLPILWILASAARIERPSPRRVVEAILLSMGLLGVVSAVLLRSDFIRGSLSWPLPFLLWAAVRFGPSGIAAALFGMTTSSIGASLAGHGPFATAHPDQSLLEMQFYLIMVSVPLTLLSAVIEAQRRLESELRASREQYQSVAETQTEMICRFRPDGTFTFVNDAFCRFVGRTRAEICELSAPEVLAPLSPAAFTPERATIVRESQRRGPDGETTWELWTDRGIFDEDGKLSEVQSVGRDITADKIGEQRKVELIAQRRIEHALREADRRKDELLAMVGHELRNPLAPIGAALEILRSTPHEDAGAAGAREVIARQLAFMKPLIDDLLDLSLIARGQMQLNPETLDAATVAREAVEMMRSQIEVRGHALTVWYPGEPVSVRADRVRLLQVLVNLLGNAAKYTHEPGRISLTVDAADGKVTFSVKDDGAGIAPDRLDRIFELFERGGAPRLAPEGQGIGLALARRLVDLHDGTIVARSEGPGRGAELVVTLAGARAGDESPHSHERMTAGAPSLDILVIDDNVDAADMLAAMLRAWGHRARAVYDGARALDAVRSRAPDVIMSDIGLPDMSGHDLAPRLLRQVDGKPLLVAISGFGDESDRARSFEAGFEHHLLKPIDPGDLAEVLAARAVSSSSG